MSLSAIVIVLSLYALVFSLRGMWLVYHSREFRRDMERLREQRRARRKE